MVSLMQAMFQRHQHGTGVQLLLAVRFFLLGAESALIFEQRPVWICQLQAGLSQQFMYLNLMVAIDDTPSKLLILYEQLDGLPSAADTDRQSQAPMCLVVSI